MFELRDYWVWDFWFARTPDAHHLFYLHAPKSLNDPDQRHWHVKIGHASSPDLLNWTDHGACFAPNAEPALDDYTTWTGSIIEHDGLWHLFYTGTSRAEGGMKQRIFRATSTDLHHWTRAGDGAALDLDERWYEEYSPGLWHDRAWRDPWVMRDPASGQFHMIFTARVKEGDSSSRGVLGHAVSDDLVEWKARPPISEPGFFGHCEVPQVIRMDDRWICLFCTEARFFGEEYRKVAPGGAVTGTHYFVADAPTGPWRLGPGPFFDGDMQATRYAGRAVEHDGQCYYFAFRHSDEDGRFIGKIDGPYRLAFDEDRGLHLESRVEALT
ncbi:glycoside hydrolase family 68 protein [Sphingomonas oleivorans]|nr:glycoside hydrolase family 68 protein [Sphingomonas oleivorans]